MTKYLLTGRGRRLLTGGGQVLMADAPGPAYSNITAEPMPVSIRLAAKVAAVAVATVAPMAVAFGLAASPTAKTGISAMPVSFGLSAKPSAWASAMPVATAVEFGAAATPSATARAVPLPTSVTFSLDALPSIAYPTAIRPRAMPLEMRLVAKPTRAAIIRPRPMPLSTALSAAISISTGAKWREKWLAVYGLRQDVLNAIDANNRSLAKAAGDLASANATAIVQTNTRVEQVDQRVTTEAQRVTVLAGRVGNVEGTQTAQGTAISNLQTTQTSQGNTLTSHSQQLVNVQSSITTLDGKTIANANATTALDARVSINEQGVAQARATWGVYLTAGNLISGVQSTNDGIVAEFNVSAHVFRLLSPAGSDGMEIRDGYIRIWKGNSQTILGNSFGVPGEGLMKWFGPNIGADACTKANATSWEDDQGNSHHGGTISAGVIHNAERTTSTGTIGTELTTSPFATLGRNRTVILSLSRSHDRYKDAMGSDGFVAGAGANAATVQLYRKIGNAAEALWKTLQVGGGVDISNEFDGPDSASSWWAGSATYNDSSPSSDDVVYRAVITGFSEQSVTHSSGSFNRQKIRQTLAIQSTEE